MNQPFIFRDKNGRLKMEGVEVECETSRFFFGAKPCFFNEM